MIQAEQVGSERGDGKVEVDRPGDMDDVRDLLCQLRVVRLRKTEKGVGEVALKGGELAADGGWEGAVEESGRRDNAR